MTEMQAAVDAAEIYKFIPLKGLLKGLCKFRSGDYRVIVSKDYETQTIEVFKIRARKNVYK